MMTAEEVIERLQLIPHPDEGGFYRETYRSDIVYVPRGFDAERCASTAIYYLMTPDHFSALHRVRSDEFWHFHLGDPIEQIHLRPDGTSAVVRIGADLENGSIPQMLIPAGVWQSARLVKGGSFALVGATVAPGFEFADYEGGDVDALSQHYPELKAWLAKW
jgi:predicted cupin superfamily sugar epimerase